MVVFTSITLLESDWQGLGDLPLLLARNVNVSSSAFLQAAGQFPVIDFSYIKQKVRLAVGVQLTFSSLVLTRYREDLPSSAPGLDLLACTLPNLLPAAGAGGNITLVLLHRSALNNRICFPGEWARQSVSSTPRPEEYPGKQNVSADLPQPNCVNDTSAPWLRRCWAVRRQYYDLITPGAIFNAMGKQEYTNYYIRVVEVALLCSGIMPEDCLMALTPIGCYHSLFPKTGSVPSPPAPQVDPPPPARTLIGAIVGGVVGGVLLAAMVSALAVQALKRRRRESSVKGKKPAVVAPGFSKNYCGQLLVPAPDSRPASNGAGKAQGKGMAPGRKQAPGLRPEPACAPTKRVPRSSSADAAKFASLLGVQVSPGGTSVIFLPVTSAAALPSKPVAAAATAATAGTTTAANTTTATAAAAATTPTAVPVTVTAAAAASMTAHGVMAADVTSCTLAGSALLTCATPAEGRQLPYREQILEQGQGQALHGRQQQQDVTGGPECTPFRRASPGSPTRASRASRQAGDQLQQPQQQQPRVSDSRPGFLTAGGTGAPLTPTTVAAPSATGAADGGGDGGCRGGTRAGGVHSGPSRVEAGVGGCGAGDPAVPVTSLTPQRPDMKRLDRLSSLCRTDHQVNLLPSSTLGKGSYGRVVEGLFQGQRVAVKLVADVHQWGGPQESLLRSFAQEVEVLGRCQHPNVVRLLAACLTPPRLCLVMELMEASLERLLHDREPDTLVPLPTVLHLGIEIGKGLEYLHPTIVHRDLKPANVLLNDPWSPKPVVKISDFGLARLRVTAVPTLTPNAGTPAYLAPEGFDACKSAMIITHKADMYSLAVLLWEMLAGRRPWRGCSLMELAFKVTEGVRLPLDHLPEARCPAKLAALIRQCWDADPQRRPAAAEVVKSLALILQEVEANGGVGVVTVQAGAGPVAALVRRAPALPPEAGGDGKGSPPSERVLGQVEILRSSDIAAEIAGAAGMYEPESIEFTYPTQKNHHQARAGADGAGRAGELCAGADGGAPGRRILAASEAHQVGPQCSSPPLAGSYSTYVAISSADRTSGLTFLTSSCMRRGTEVQLTSPSQQQQQQQQQLLLRQTSCSSQPLTSSGHPQQQQPSVQPQ